MTDQPRYIAKPPVLKPAEDFYRLRQEGISFIEEMGTELWTDYNAHDPGITILEALCYGITELAYRTGWDIKDILTPDPAEKKAVSAADQTYPGQYFPSARDILTVNPVTSDDFRRLLIDFEEVRNAWVTEVIDNKKEKNGLYNVLIEPEIEPESVTQTDELIKSIREKLNKYRNLCEDFNEIELIETEKIVVCAEIDLRPDADINSVYESILLEIENYLNPPIPFQTLDELIEKKEKIEVIFNGPQVKSGFIQTEELDSASLKKKLYLSDIINILMDIEGMVSIRCLRLINENKEKNENNKWEMSICGQKKLELCLEKSNFVFYKNGLPVPPQYIGEDRLSQLRKETERGKAEFSEKQDIPIPTGTFRNLNEYFPVQYSLPTAYGIGPDGLPAQASDERRARAKQLQGYLMPFEQILANAFSQLEHVGDLFSLDQKKTNSYAVKEFNDEIITGIEEIFNSIHEFQDLGSESGKDIDCMEQCPVKEKCEATGEQDCIIFWNAAENQECNAAVSYARKTIDEILPKYNQQERQNRFLDHLLARFGERFDDYRILNQVEKENSVEDKTTLIKDLIEDKISFIKIQQKIGSDRAKAFDYTRNNGNYLECKWSEIKEIYIVTDSNAPELKRRVSLLLGCPNLSFYWERKENTLFELKLKNENGDDWVNETCNIESSEYPHEVVGNLLVGKSKYIVNSISELERSDLIEIEKKFKSRTDELLRWSIFQRTIVVEHILLRPKSDIKEQNDPTSDKKDQYSFNLTFVIPGWHELENKDSKKREEFIAMRDFTERMIRQETPSHLLVNIIWADRKDFNDFEIAWRKWLENIGKIDGTGILEQLYSLKNKNIRDFRLGKMQLSGSSENPKHLGKSYLRKMVLANVERPIPLRKIVLDNSKLLEIKNEKH